LAKSNQVGIVCDTFAKAKFAKSKFGPSKSDPKFYTFDSKRWLIKPRCSSVSNCKSYSRIADELDVSYTTVVDTS
jgi:hypothetical protein